jgi:glycosyltransferase involved in cell wall biosynthesis
MASQSLSPARTGMPAARIPHAVRNSAVSSISAFIPCYNDAATIVAMVNATLRTIEVLGVDGEVIVVNDGSTDSSQQVLDDLLGVEPRLRVIRHETNRGYGAALRSGFAAATRQWIFYTDGDGQFDPTELAALVHNASVDVDVVQGYKISRADGLVRQVVGETYRRAVSTVFGLQIHDTDCDFRLIRGSLLDRILLEHSSGAICVELVRKLQDAGATFVEVPVHHYPRVHGKSQFFTPGRVARTLRDLVVLRSRLPFTTPAVGDPDRDTNHRRGVAP